MSWSSSLQTSTSTTTTDSQRTITVQSPVLVNQDESLQSSHRAGSSASSSSSSSSLSSACSSEDKTEIRCAVANCSETAFKSRKYMLLLWKCKYHRNKSYKETYKKRKAKAKKNSSTCNDRKGPIIDGHGNKVPIGDLRSGANQQLSMLEQVLNEKKMALMQSPVVLNFLQKQQLQKRKHQHQEHQPKTCGMGNQGNYGQSSH